MRRVLVALLSAVVVGLMLVPSVSAGTKTITFTDRQGDLGKALLCWGQGNHEFGDPLSWWSGNSPISEAGYLDMLSGWVSVKGGTVTMGLTVNSKVPTNGKLPEGVTEVRWLWAFFTNSEILDLAGPNTASHVVYVLWDGVDFTAALVDRTSGSPPFAVTYLDAFSVDGTVLMATINVVSTSGAVAWLGESLVMYGSPWSLDQWPSASAWWASDITDYQGPLAGYWPLLAMP